LSGICFCQFLLSVFSALLVSNSLNPQATRFAMSPSSPPSLLAVGCENGAFSFLAAPSAKAATQSPKIDQISRFKGAIFLNATLSCLFTSPYPTIPAHETKPLGCRQAVTPSHGNLGRGVLERGWVERVSTYNRPDQILSFIAHTVFAIVTSVTV